MSSMAQGPGLARMVLEAVGEALTLPFPATTGDGERYREVLEARVGHVRRAVEALLDLRVDSRDDVTLSEWYVARLRAQVAETPAVGYVPVTMARVRPCPRCGSAGVRPVPEDRGACWMQVDAWSCGGCDLRWCTPVRRLGEGVECPPWALVSRLDLAGEGRTVTVERMSRPVAVTLPPGTAAEGELVAVERHGGDLVSVGTVPGWGGELPVEEVARQLAYLVGGRCVLPGATLEVVEGREAGRDQAAGAADVGDVGDVEGLEDVGDVEGLEDVEDVEDVVPGEVPAVLAALVEDVGEGLEVPRGRGLVEVKPPARGPRGEFAGRPW